MHGQDLIARIEAHLLRQIAWLEETLAELRTLEADLDGPDLERLAKREGRRARRAADLEAERDALTREWRDATPSDEARAAVQVLAGRAEALVAQLAQVNAAAQRVAAGRLHDVREALEALERNRGVLGKYRVPETPGPGLIDREA